MCLAVPGRLMTIEGDQALVDLHGNRVPVCTVLVPEARAGDWVLVHAGFVIQKLTEEDARETWKVLSEAGIARVTDP